MDVTPLPKGAGRRCLDELNSLHATIYFAPDFGMELAAHGVEDPTAVYLAGRAAPWGAVGAGPVAAAFNGLNHELIARHLPRLWTLVAPAAVVALRLRAADAVLRRFLGDAALTSADMTEAAETGRTGPRSMRAARAADVRGARRPPRAARAASRPVARGHAAA